MSIKIEPKLLKITLYTNIPIGNDYEKDILTFSTIISPELKDVRIPVTQYPFFTSQIKYDETVLGFYSYDEIVRTFFKKDLFVSRLCNTTDVIPIEIKGPTNETSILYKKRRENIDNNIMLMLKYLLPTKWPVINNHFSSYDLFKLKDPMNTLLFNPLLDRKYINLKLSSGIFSLKKVVWLNDLMNVVDNFQGVEVDDAFLKPIALKYSNQELIKKLNEKDTSDTVEDIKNCYKGKCKSSELTYVGIQIDTDPYEAMIDVELFEGEIKDGEEKNIKCPYYGDFLGEKLKELIRPNKKEHGKITKNPLYSIANKISKKKGFIEKEEVDEKTKAKRKEEDNDYNEIDQDIRTRYELFSNPFFEQALQGRLKAKIKKYDINAKGLYFFLQQNLNPFLKFITASNSDLSKLRPLSSKSEESTLDETPRMELKSLSGRPEGKEYAYEEYIEKKLEQYAEKRNNDKSFKDTYDELKLKFELAKSFFQSIEKKNPGSNKGGGKTEKKRRRIKKQHTRRGY